MVGEHAVVLLGHAPVERAQSRLEVCHGKVYFDGCHRGGKRGVGVPVNQNLVRHVLKKDRFQLRHHGARLLTVGPRANTQVDIGMGNAKVAEEGVAHHVVVVLARVHNHVVRPSGKCTRHRA